MKLLSALLCIVIGCSSATVNEDPEYAAIYLEGVFDSVVNSETGFSCSVTDSDFGFWIEALDTDEPYIPTESTTKPILCDPMVLEDDRLFISCEFYDQSSFPWYYAYYDIELNDTTLFGQLDVTIELPDTPHWCVLTFAAWGTPTFVNKQ